MIDEEALAPVRRALAEVADRQRDLMVAEANFHHAVRLLHATGGSLQEIAAAVGLSRQRIHQIVKASGGVPGRRRRRTGADLSCSFCHLHQDEVARLIAGPEVHICDRCVQNAVTVIGPGADTDRCSFCGKTGVEGQGLFDGDGGPPRICAECLVLCHEILADEPEAG